VYIIRTVYYIRGLELMKLIFAVLDVSLMMRLTRCYKTEGFYIYHFKHDNASQWKSGKFDPHFLKNP